MKTFIDEAQTKARVKYSQLWIKKAAKMNNSAFPGDTPPPEPLGFKIPKIIVYVAILLVCTAGNMAVIAVILGSRHMRSLQGNILILNLAFVDLLTPIMSIPFDLGLEENHYVWPYGSILCKLLFPAATLLSTCSSLTLAAISLDRYRTLLHPFKSKLSVKQVKCIVAVVDCFSVVFVLPYAAFLGLQNLFCVEKWPEFFYRQIYTVFLVVVQYALPLCFMITMYILASVKLFASAESVRKISHPTENGPRRASAAFRERLMRRESFAVSQEQNAKVTKMFVIIVVAFAICTLPNQVLWLWIDFGKDGDVTSLAKEIIVCRFFTYTNGCVNPIIFFIFKRDYRQGLFKILRKIARRKPETDLQRMRRIWKKVDISGPVTQPRRSRRLRLSQNGKSPVNRHTSITSAVLDTSGRATHCVVLNEEDSYRTYPPRKRLRKTSENVSTSAERRLSAAAHLFTKRPSRKSAESAENNEAVKDPNGNITVALLTNSASSVLPAHKEEVKFESDAIKLNLLQSGT